MARIHVLKFGSSVLRSEADLPAVATEMLRWRMTGAPVIAVVSAFAGETDRRILEANENGLEAESPARAGLIAAEEFASADALARELEGRGETARALSPAEIRLRAAGNRMDAAPLSLDRRFLEATLEECPLLIIPGYSGIDQLDEPVLLGRGGSDLSALFIAAELGAPECHLIKDVDGLYDRDPNHHADAQRYETVSTLTAYKVGGVLVQPKAISFADTRTLTIHVTAMGAHAGTRIYANAPDRFHLGRELNREAG